VSSALWATIVLKRRQMNASQHGPKAGGTCETDCRDLLQWVAVPRNWCSIRGQIPAMTAFKRRANGIQKHEDDLYAINAAKTEFREAFNHGDVSLLLALADPDLVNFSDGQPSEFGESGLDALKTQLTSLFASFMARLTVIVIEVEIRLQGNVAYDYGWHDLTLTPKEGGAPIRRRNRYVDIWRKNKKGKWKLWMYIDNQDVADPFLPEQIPAPGA